MTVDLDDDVSLAGHDIDPFGGVANVDVNLERLFEPRESPSSHVKVQWPSGASSGARGSLF